ncbi:hypothetical protein C2845_PM02G03990 [Panicum miliaceum]|uniref:Uncharacterized protein n=1 Tax=Panicum miliaceum TaxID=4540 RepID=A0A3L6SC39_PANMI|nr:hypothetical protein C2845_PM02G03990 [Panicum miliaceum]
MSRGTRQQPAAGSRRTRRAEHEQPPAALAESPRIVSNPIFRCEAGPSQPKPPPPGDQLRCVYGPNSLYALVHDPASASAASGGIGKPLPLPPCRAHRAGPGAGSRVPASRTGPARVAGGPHGRALRRVPPDPFLAAYVACSKSAGGGKDATAAGADRPQQKQKKQGNKKKKKKKKKRAAKKKVKQGEEEVVRGCGGIWSGRWAAGAKYAGAMSCRHGCAVADQQQVMDAPATAAKKEAGPTLDLSWAPAVLSARALERRREQR